MSLFSGPPPMESDSSVGPSDVSITDVSSGSDLEEELDTLNDSNTKSESLTLGDRTKQSSLSKKSSSSSKKNIRSGKSSSRSGSERSRGRLSQTDSDDDEPPSDSDDDDDDDEPPPESDDDISISSDDDDDDLPPSSDDDDDSLPPSSGEEDSDEDVADIENELADMKLPTQRVRSTGQGGMKVVLPSNADLEGGLSALSLGKKNDQSDLKNKLNGNGKDVQSSSGGAQTEAKTKRPSFSGGNTVVTPVNQSSTIGYKMFQGKYEDDEFEPVGIKVIPEAFQLSVHISKMDEPERESIFCTYELGDSCMATDPSDPTKLYFRTIDALITFKANQAVEVINLSRFLPEGVLTHDTKYVITDTVKKSAIPGSKKNILGTSKDREFQPPDSMQLEGGGLLGYNRTELLESHIRKPQLSVRRVRQICKWLTSMRIWKSPIDITNLHASVCNGVCLSRLVKKLVPNTEFIHLNEKALSKSAAIGNLEKALGVIWRAKCVNNSRIPTATDIYNGNTYRIATMFQEIFEVYVQRPLMKQAVKVLKWYNNILQQYNRRLPVGVFTESDFQAVWSHFQSGTALFCILYHLYGPILVGQGSTVVKIDPIRMVNEPANLSEYRTNMLYVFSILKALEIDVIWNVMDWLSYPDADFVLLQLTIIYDALKSRQCSLPPAQGINAGVTSGPQGLMVVGMIFSDTVVAGDDENVRASASMRRNRAVLLGVGEDPLKLLPVDTGGRTGRYYSPELPAGLAVASSRLEITSMDIKSKRAASSRKDWLSTSDQSEDPLNPFMSTQVNLLKQVNQGSAEPKFGSEDVNYTDISDEGVETAIKTLEAMVKKSRVMLDRKEDLLAERYVSLETKVASSEVTADSYDTLFHELERARLNLEDDRVKVEEIYQLRLESIHTQHEEARARLESSINEAKEKVAKASAAQSPSKTGVSISITASRSGKKGGSPTKHKKLSSEEKSKLESSWIGLHGRTNQSQNMKIRRTVEASSDARAITRNGKKTIIENKRPATKSTQNHESIWQAFKTSLAQRTLQWRNSRNERNTRLESILASSGKKESAKTYTPGTGGQIDVVKLERESELTIDEEYKRLSFEDTYRRKYLYYKFGGESPGGENGRSGNRISIVENPEVVAAREARRKKKEGKTDGQYQNPDSPGTDQDNDSRSKLNANVFSASAAASRRVSTSSRPAGSSSFAAGSAMDPLIIRREIDSIMRHISPSRHVKMIERSVKKEYMIHAESVTATGVDVTSRDAHDYFFMWEGGTDKGQVDILEIEDLYKSPKDENSLVFELGESPSILVSSGGRTQLVLQFATSEECSAYVNFINKLKNHLLNLRDISDKKFHAHQD